MNTELKISVLVYAHYIDYNLFYFNCVKFIRVRA